MGKYVLYSILYAVVDTHMHIYIYVYIHPTYVFTLTQDVWQ